MRWIKKLLLSVSLVAVLVMTAQPTLGVAAANASFSHVMFVEESLSFLLHTDQCITEESSVQVKDEMGTSLIKELELDPLGSCDGTGNYTYEFSGSVVDATYSPIRLEWVGTLSPPIFHGMDLTETDLTFYLEGLDPFEVHIENNIYSNFYVKPAGMSGSYIALPGLNPLPNISDPFSEHYFYVDFDLTVQEIEEKQSFPWLDPNDPIDLNYLEARAAFIVKYFEDGIYKHFLYMSDPVFHSVDSQPKGELLSLELPGQEIMFDIDLPGDWDIKKVVFVPKDESGQVITSLPFEYDEGKKFYLSDAVTYDIHVIGTVGDLESGEVFLLTEKDVTVQSHGSKTITFNEEIIEIEPRMHWNDLDESASEYDGMELLLIWILPEKYDSFASFFDAYPLNFNSLIEYDLNKLYLTGNNDERQIGWEYCLTIEHYCTFNEADIFMYVTDVLRNGGEIIMSNQFEGDLRFETTFILDYEMDPGNPVKQALPYKLNIYDSYGNMVLMMQDHMGAFLFLKYGHTDPIGWSLANNPIISSSTFLEFAEEWTEEPSYGLYEVVFGTYTLPVTFKKSQYLYYLNVEEWYSTMRAAGLHDDDHIDLRQLVKLMRHHADSDFWSDEALRAFHLQFLMEFIQPRYIQAPDVVIID